jgi:hypothetical protein
MLKRLAILGLLALGVLAGAQNQVPPNGGKQQEHPQAHPEVSQPNAPAAPAPRGAKQDASTSQEQAQEESTCEKYLKDAFAAANLSNWVLAGLGIVGGIAAIRTLVLIKRQADIMESQAKDARESGAQTFAILKEQTDNLLISAKAATVSAMAADESAKVAMGVSVPTLAVYKFSFINKEREAPAAFFQCPKVGLVLKNYGQSPAFLRKYAITLSWGDDKPGKCPAYPFDEEQVIAPGDTYRFTSIDLEVLDLPPQVVVEDLVCGKRHLTFAGWVSYKDIFGSPIRRLRFCKALLEYDPDPTKMVILDSSPLNMAVDPDDQ